MGSGSPLQLLMSSTPQLSEDERKAKRALQMRNWRANNRERDRANRTRQRAANPTRQRDYDQKYYAANKEKIAARAREKKYNITPEGWEAMFLAQDKKCALCGTDTPRGKGNQWHTDHCHFSGKVRGILCQPCNTALGLFGDNSHTLAQAIHYLEKHNGERPID